MSLAGHTITLLYYQPSPSLNFLAEPQLKQMNLTCNTSDATCTSCHPSPFSHPDAQPLHHNHMSSRTQSTSHTLNKPSLTCSGSHICTPSDTRRTPPTKAGAPARSATYMLPSTTAFCCKLRHLHAPQYNSLLL
jgi:hypothetical protein